MIEMHANDMASRDMLRTVDPMTLFAVSGLESHRGEPICLHTDLFFSCHEELWAHECCGRMQPSLSHESSRDMFSLQPYSARCGDSRRPRVCIQRDVGTTDVIPSLATPGSSAV